VSYVYRIGQKNTLKKGDSNMPFITEKVAIKSRGLKRSCKLLECQKEMVIHFRQLGESYNTIANRFKVSKRLIIFICNPDALKRNILLRKARGGSKIYYDREKHNEAMKKHRSYKQELFAKAEHKKKSA
jgi:hypothetical protein